MYEVGGTGKPQDKAQEEGRVTLSFWIQQPEESRVVGMIIVC